MLNTVDFNLFDRPRHLKYDINAIADIERETKTGITALLQQERLGFDSIRILLWGGLKHEDRTLTVEKVGDLIQNYMVDQKSNLFQALTVFSDKIVEGLTKSGLIGDTGGNPPAEETEK
jgi:hypothetical protein